MALLEGYAPHNPMIRFVNAFTDHRYCNGQCQQQQHADGIARVTMPEWGVSFSAQDARMRCMPHTIHLVAIKVL